MPSPSPKLIESIADRLSRPIPKPAAPVAKTRKTWQTLKLDQKLLLRVRWFRPGLDLPPGTEVRVSKVDSLGISLTHISEQGTLSLLRWMEKDWKGMFEKVRRKKK